MMNKILKYCFLGIIGSVTYVFFECIWRGWSHWSMGLLGGICFIAIGLINEYLSWNTPLLLQMIIGGTIITILEFLTGCIVNLWLGWNIWSYANLPYNLLGQISLYSSLGWIGLSLVAIVLDDFIRWKCFNEEKPHYKWI